MKHCKVLIITNSNNYTVQIIIQSKSLYSPNHYTVYLHSNHKSYVTVVHSYSDSYSYPKLNCSSFAHAPYFIFKLLSVPFYLLATSKALSLISIYINASLLPLNINVLSFLSFLSIDIGIYTYCIDLCYS